MTKSITYTAVLKLLRAELAAAIIEHTESGWAPRLSLPLSWQAPVS